jgi:hypothetical protein
VTQKLGHVVVVKGTFASKKTYFFHSAVLLVFFTVRFYLFFSQCGFTCFCRRVLILPHSTAMREALPQTRFLLYDPVLLRRGFISTWLLIINYFLNGYVKIQFQ